jgi:hypothetical protein
MWPCFDIPVGGKEFGGWNMANRDRLSGIEALRRQR